MCDGSISLGSLDNSDWNCLEMVARFPPENQSQGFFRYEVYKSVSTSSNSLFSLLKEALYLLSVFNINHVWVLDERIRNIQILTALPTFATWSYGTAPSWHYLCGTGMFQSHSSFQVYMSTLDDNHSASGGTISLMPSAHFFAEHAEKTYSDLIIVTLETIFYNTTLRLGSILLCVICFGE